MITPLRRVAAGVGELRRRRVAKRAIGRNTRFSTNTYMSKYWFALTLKSPKISGKLPEFTGECHLGILHSSSLLNASRSPTALAHSRGRPTSACSSGTPLCPPRTIHAPTRLRGARHYPRGGDWDDSVGSSRGSAAAVKVNPTSRKRAPPLSSRGAPAPWRPVWHRGGAEGYRHRGVIHGNWLVTIGRSPLLWHGYNQTNIRH